MAILRRTKVIWLVWVVRLLIGPLTDARCLAAQTNSAAGLSLTEAQGLAFHHNWDLIAARSDVDAATAQRIIAREFPNPTLSLGTSKLNVDGQPNSTTMGNGLWERSYDTVIAINQLIEIGGKRRSRQASSNAGLRGAEARLADARRLLDQGVAQAYVAVLLAERDQQILNESAASLRKEAQIAAIRQKAGDISASDQSQIEIAASRLELDAQTAEANARTARIQLEILLGEKEPRGTVKLSEELEALTDFAGDPAAERIAMDQRADLAAAEAAKAKAQADIRLQKALRVPDPTISFQYEHAPAGAPNSIGVGISFPLPLWNRNHGNIAAAEAAAEQAAAQAGKVRAQIVGDIATARSAFESAQLRWRRYREELLPKSLQVRETIAFAYERGGAALLDLLAAQRNYNEVRLATAQAAADSASAAAALRAALLSFSKPASR